MYLQMDAQLYNGYICVDLIISMYVKMYIHVYICVVVHVYVHTFIYLHIDEGDDKSNCNSRTTATINFILFQRRPRRRQI